MNNPDLTLAFNLPPEQAIEYLRSKGYAIDFDWKKASAEAKAKSFWMANQYKYDILADVKNSLVDALEKGYTGQQFQDAVMQKLRSRGYVPEKEGITPSRLNSVFRNNVQSAYMSGNYKSLMETVDILPYWRMVVILDRRSSKTCPPLKDVVARWDDPFWETHFPPLHFFCRSTVVGMTEAMAAKRGLNILSTTETADLAKSHPTAVGFNHNPAATWSSNPNSMLPDCIEGSTTSFANQKCIQRIPGQRTWKDYGRPDLKDIPADELQDAPAMLRQARNAVEAQKVVNQAVGITDENPVVSLGTPVGELLLTDKLLMHIVQKRDAARERFANFIIPTLTDPYEVYLTEYDDGFRFHFIKIFKAKTNLFCVARIDPDGTFLWNAIPMKTGTLNGRRSGELLFSKKENR